MAQNNAVVTRYFSGQGIVLVATRDVNGDPEGFRNIGNVSELTVGIEQDVLEHKESSTGQRAIDLRLTQETTVNFAATMEALNLDNLNLALFGTSASVTGASVATEPQTAYLDKTIALDKGINISAVVVKKAGGTPVYELDKNYVVNAEAGSIFIFSDAEQTARSATANIANLEALEIDYDFASYEQTEALVTARPEVWVRFEGLNTADNNNPVNVDIFRVGVDPLTELALINDELAQFVLEGSALSDATKLTGSKFFRVRATA